MSTEESRPHSQDFWEATLQKDQERQLREDAWYYSSHKAELQSYLRLMKRLKNLRSEKAAHFLTEKEIKILRVKYSVLIASVVVLVLLSIHLFIPKEWPEASARYEIKDPERAMQEAKKALLIFSEALNEGQKELENLGKLNEIKESIEKKSEIVTP